MPEPFIDMLRRAAPDELVAKLELALSDDSPAVRRDAALAIATTLVALHEPGAADGLRRLLGEAAERDADAAAELDAGGPAVHPDPGADVPLFAYEDEDNRLHLLL
jgi:hypothetical protein